MGAPFCDVTTNRGLVRRRERKGRERGRGGREKGEGEREKEREGGREREGRGGREGGEGEREKRREREEEREREGEGEREGRKRGRRGERGKGRYKGPLYISNASDIKYALSFLRPSGELFKQQRHKLRASKREERQRW